MSETNRSVDAEDGLDVDCPVCGYPFNEEGWETMEQGGDHWGGYAVEKCPECENGKLTISY